MRGEKEESLESFSMRAMQAMWVFEKASPVRIEMLRVFPRQIGPEGERGYFYQAVVSGAPPGGPYAGGFTVEGGHPFQNPFGPKSFDRLEDLSDAFNDIDPTGRSQAMYIMGVPAADARLNTLRGEDEPWMKLVQGKGPGDLALEMARKEALRYVRNVVQAERMRFFATPHEHRRVHLAERTSTVLMQLVPVARFYEAATAKLKMPGDQQRLSFLLIKSAKACHDWALDDVDTERHTSTPFHYLTKRLDQLSDRHLGPKLSGTNVKITVRMPEKISGSIPVLPKDVSPSLGMSMG